MTSSQPTSWRQSNSHQSEFGCVLMSPRPNASAASGSSSIPGYNSHS
jgi:hypothetical protein